MNILIPDVLSPPADVEREVFGPEADIVLCEATAAEEIPDELWSACDAILAWDQIEYNSPLLDKLERCRAIIRVGVGYDNIDLIGTRRRKIVVCSVPDYGTEEVADHTIALLLSLVRGLPEYVKRVLRRDWSRENSMPFRLRGKVIGIIGLGRIGTATAMRAKTFGMKVVFYDPYINDGYDKSLGVTRVESLKEIAETADVISIHTPLTHETEGMINDSFFADVRKSPLLINTARGQIVDIACLYDAMKDDIVKAAGLDVLPIEPSDDSQQLIVDYENDEEWLRGRLVVTPHIAFYSPEAYKEMRKKAALEAFRVINGEKARNCVNEFYEH